MWRKQLLILLLWLWATLAAMSQHPFYRNYRVEDGLLSNYTYFVFQDSKGYIWVSNDVGVSRFDGHRFSNYNTSNGMSDNEVFSMYEDRKGRIWFATLNGKPCYYQNGVIYSEKNQYLLQQCNLNGLVMRIFEQADGAIVYATGNCVLSIYVDEQRYKRRDFSTDVGDIWYGSDGERGGIASKCIVAVKHDSVFKLASLPALSNPVRTVKIGHELLIGSQHRLFRFNFGLNRVEKAIDLLARGNEIIYLKIHRDKLWVGTRKGFFVYEYPGLRLVRSLLTDYSVTAAVEDREGGLWFSTLEEGIFYIPTPDILQFGARDGLFFDRIACLARDDRQRLWAGAEGSTYYIYDGERLTTHHVLQKSARNKSIFNIRHFPTKRRWWLERWER